MGKPLYQASESRYMHSFVCVYLYYPINCIMGNNITQQCVCVGSLLKVVKTSYRVSGKAEELVLEGDLPEVPLDDDPEAELPVEPGGNVRKTGAGGEEHLARQSESMWEPLLGGRLSKSSLSMMSAMPRGQEVRL